MNIIIFDYCDNYDNEDDGHTRSGQPDTRQCKPALHCCNYHELVRQIGKVNNFIHYSPTNIENDEMNITNFTKYNIYKLMVLPVGSCSTPSFNPRNPANMYCNF